MTAARLVLRPFSVAFARAVVDPHVTGFNVAIGYPHRDSPDIARGVIDEPESSTCATWIITRVADGAVVGDCGWFAVAGAEDTVEIGYGLAESARGQGFATEAVAALLARYGSSASSESLLPRVTRTERRPGCSRSSVFDCASRPAVSGDTNASSQCSRETRLGGFDRGSTTTTLP